MRRKLFCSTHPITPIPFEAFFDGKWHWVDHVRVKVGAILIESTHNASLHTSKHIHGNNLRLRSRKAQSFDCRYFLREGMDICVFSQHQGEDQGLDKEQEPVLHDARIVSIKRDPHEGHDCTCTFAVKLYRRETNNNVIKCTLEGESEYVTIHQIAVLQRLLFENRRGGQYSWGFSENCAFIQKSRLLTGAFGSELTWLVVLSEMKQMEFDIRVVQSRITYFIVGSLGASGMNSRLALCDSTLTSEDTKIDDDDCTNFSASFEEKVMVMTFETSDRTVKPRIQTLASFLTRNFSDGEVVDGPLCSIPDTELDSDTFHDLYGLRRSKRQKTQPDRFLSTFKRYHVKEQELPKQVAWEIDQGKLKNLPEDDDARDIIPRICGIAQRSRGKIKTRKSSRSADSSSSNTCRKSESRSNSMESSMDSTSGGNSRGSSKCDENGGPVSPKRSFRQPNRQALSGSASGRNPLLSSSECKKMMGKCIEKIKLKMKRQPEIMFNLEDSCSSRAPLDATDFSWDPPSDPRVEEREYEELWREMEYALAILPFLEDKHEMDIGFSNGKSTGSNEDGEEPCKHDFALDEELGIICKVCKYVITERRYIFPSFGGRYRLSGEGREREKDAAMPSSVDIKFATPAPSSSMPLSGQHRNVWSLIPELKSRLYPHQKKAFKFLWRNITGSFKPQDARLSKNSSGCVISHSPGTGKTLLVVSFLVSYLKVFAGQRPLILAPNITLCVWIKEFEKWGMPFPLYTIHSMNTYRKNLQGSKAMPSKFDRRPNLKSRHVLDCLEKLQKWHEEPSILLMNYSSFFLLAQGDQKYDQQRFMAKVLVESPGLLILDEGHNPRSTSSKLRNLLMKVKTKLRILLSGTLFQNNFKEYFNTLCLARPQFISDVIKELRSPRANYGKGERTGRKVKERNEELARKIFIQEIGRRLESTKEEKRRNAFEKLMTMTRGFVDVHAGGGMNGLPGLEVYTIVLNTEGTQKEVLCKLQQLRKQRRNSWELELLVTVASIHPSLITTISGVAGYFNEEELGNAAHLRKNYTKGSKVKFVIDVVQRSTSAGEKVLIFCRNIPPIEMLVEILEMIFGWRRGEEVLVLRGEQDLFDRAKIIDKFKPAGISKVLLASTTACSEGISLTAASRVIMLDSEWNYSKTRQAIARAFRPGQERVVYVYQLLAAGTLEKEKYSSNERKEWLANMVTTGNYIEHSASGQVGDVDDDVLKEILEVDKMEIFHYSQ